MTLTHAAAATAAHLADAGLLAPVRAGTRVEAVTSDLAWVQAMLDAEAALARAQATVGTLPASAAEVITRVARADRLDVRALALAARETANPVVGLVQAFTEVVAAEDLEAAEFVHRGSTSQDVLDTGTMLVARKTLDLILADLRRTVDALTALATAHRRTPAVARTLALHAVPTTFGLRAAGWRELVLDAEERVARVQRNLPVSLGGAAGTLAGYLEYAALAEGGTLADPDGYVTRLVDAYAGETGLARPALPWHALRTPVADLAAALAFAAGALGKIAVDVQALTRTEVGEVTEPAVSGRGASSAMPHKRNPVLATLVRSAALQVPALSAALAQCLVTEDERSAGVWHAEWPLLRDCLRLTGGAAQTAAELVEGLTVRPDRMRSNLDMTESQVVSERLVAHLAPTLGKAPAKALLTRAAQEAQTTRQPLATVLARMPEVPRSLVDRLVTLCDPTDYTGAAAVLVEQALRR